MFLFSIIIPSVLPLTKYTQCFCLSGVDSSLPAIELAKENIALNGMDPGRISFLKQDATVFMKDALSRNETWDIVILDPPKLAPRRKVYRFHWFPL